MKSGRGILQDLTIVIEDLAIYRDSAAALSRLHELAGAIRRRGIALFPAPQRRGGRCVCCGKPHEYQDCDLCYACQ